MSERRLIKMKIPDSISSMVYDMKYPWMWIVMIWILALIGLFIMMPHYQIIAFLSCSCLGFVGAMPLIKNEKNAAHYVLAIIAGVLSQIWVLLINYKSLSIWILFLLLMCIPKLRSKWCLIMEIICLISIILTQFNFCNL